MAVMGLRKKIKSRRRHYRGYGRRYSLVDGSNGVMEKDIVKKMSVMGLWKRIV